MSADGFLGGGDVYLNTIVNGISQGWQGPFHAEEFQIKADSELKQMISRGRADYGQIKESVALPKPFQLSIKFTKFDKTGMALALMGTTSALTQTAGALASEPITAKKDIWVPLSKANLTGPLTVKDNGGTVTYVEGTDYLVNRQLGWVMALTAGAIADAATIKVSGNHLAITGSQVQGAAKTSVRTQVKLDGVNFVDGLPVIVQVDEAIITSKAAVAFIGDNFASIPLEGQMKTLNGKTSPFTVDLRDA